MKPRGIFIAGNWKMNHGVQETVHFFEVLRLRWDSLLSSTTREAFQKKYLKACIIPPFVCLERAQQLAHPLQITIAAQNASGEKQGAFTGEVSGPMLRELGIDTVLIGHSERRQYFGETDELVQKRLEGLLNQGFHVILCIGETQEERQRGDTFGVLKKQLGILDALEILRVNSESTQRLTIAYEPVWAIGTGVAATPEQAEEVHRWIRGELAERVFILYGGSVTPKNLAAFLKQPNIDGALVGGASLDPEIFLACLEAVSW